MKNTTVDSLLQKLYQEAKRQFDSKEITDREYTDILEMIGEVEFGFAGMR